MSPTEVPAFHIALGESGLFNGPYRVQGRWNPNGGVFVKQGGRVNDPVVFPDNPDYAPSIELPYNVDLATLTAENTVVFNFDTGRLEGDASSATELPSLCSAQCSALLDGVVTDSPFTFTPPGKEK